jgi:hypothetical protein
MVEPIRQEGLTIGIEMYLNLEKQFRFKCDDVAIHWKAYCLPLLQPTLKFTITQLRRGYAALQRLALEGRSLSSLG